MRTIDATYTTVARHRQPILRAVDAIGPMVATPVIWFLWVATSPITATFFVLEFWDRWRRR